MKYWAKDFLLIILFVAIGLCGLYLLFGVGSLFGPDRGSWDKVNIDWDYGSIVVDDAAGDVTYAQSFTSLYTKDAIACKDYQITVSFPAGVTLMAYFFDENDAFVSSKEIGELGKRIVVGEVPESATCMRLCLTPDGGNDIFKMPLLDIGNVMQKWKYSGYVKLEINNSTKPSVDDVNGV